jgi:hypothetical protein
MRTREHLITPPSLACTNGSDALVDLPEVGANPNTLTPPATPLMTCGEQRQHERGADAARAAPR